MFAAISRAMRVAFPLPLPAIPFARVAVDFLAPGVLRLGRHGQ